MKYSFVIPAYKAAEVIENCVGNIAQDIAQAKLADDAEILVVLNGPEDDSRRKLQKIIASRKENIKILESPKGASKARNLGLEKARGEYVIFVDADDKWQLGALEKIQEDIGSREADLYCYGFLKGSGQVTDVYRTPFVEGAELNSAISWMLEKPTLRMSVWAKVFRREVILENKLEFDENLRYSEDSEFLIRFLVISKAIFFSKETIYRYTLSGDSTMSATKEMAGDYVKSLQKSKKVLSLKLPKVDGFEKYAMTQFNIIMVHEIFSLNNPDSFGRKLLKMKEMLDTPIFKSSLKNLRLRDCLSKQLIAEFFLKIKLYKISGKLFEIRAKQNREARNDNI